MKFTAESNYKEMVAVAKEFGIKYVGLTKVAIAEKVNAALAAKEAKVTKIVDNCGGLVAVGKKGVTNFQMIPAIIANLGNQDNLVKLYNTYPAVYASSAKYINKKNRPVVEAVMATVAVA